MFISNIRQLRTDGVLTDDETVAIVASEMTEPLLALLDDEVEPDADTISEAIERVRASYREQADTAAREAIRAAQSETRVAQAAATAAIQRTDELEKLIDVRVNALASVSSTLLFGIVALVLIAAAVLSLPGVFDSIGASSKWIARSVLIAAAVFGVLGATYGATLTHLRSRVHEWITEQIRRTIFRPPQRLPNDSGMATLPPRTLSEQPRLQPGNDHNSGDPL